MAKYVLFVRRYFLDTSQMAQTKNPLLTPPSRLEGRRPEGSSEEESFRIENQTINI